MALDKFRIRIARDGRIYFEGRELSEERIRSLRDLLEDSLGTVQEIRPAPGEDDPGRGVLLPETERRSTELRRR